MTTVLNFKEVLLVIELHNHLNIFVLHSGFMRLSIFFLGMDTCFLAVKKNFSDGRKMHSSGIQDIYMII